MNEVISNTETLLLCLLYGEATENFDGASGVIKRGGVEGGIFDAGAALPYTNMTPSKCYTLQQGDDDRLYATDNAYLLHAPQDIIGDSSEVAHLVGPNVSWVGYRKMRKLPRHAWTASPRASHYEVHQRIIYPNGQDFYFKRIAGISSSGKPVACGVQGAKTTDSTMDGRTLILSASVIEDAHRSDVLTATFKDAIEITFPVPIGEHKDVFSIRDAPLTPAGRRKAIVHWVSRHLRKLPTKPMDKTTVSPHWRGVREFTIDGLSFALATN